MYGLVRIIRKSERKNAFSFRFHLPHAWWTKFARVPAKGVQNLFWHCLAISKRDEGVCELYIINLHHKMVIVPDTQRAQSADGAYAVHCAAVRMYVRIPSSVFVSWCSLPDFFLTTGLELARRQRTQTEKCLSRSPPPATRPALFAGVTFADRTNLF